MERYWQWIKGQLFVSRSNKVFNKVNRINSLWLFWCIYFSYTKYYCYKNYAVPDSSPAGTKPENNNNKKKKQVLIATTQVAFKNLAPFKGCRTEVTDTFVDYPDFIKIAMPMYNLIEYSDN